MYLKVRIIKRNYIINKDENLHRFAKSVIRGELLEREREIENDEKERERGKEKRESNK